MLAESSLLRRCGGRWAWEPARTPPSAAALARCGFHEHKWAEGCPRDAPNLLLLLHGLGDRPAAFAAFASRLSLPLTSALALGAPMPLPLGLPGSMWHASFEEDGELLDGSNPQDRRRLESLAGTTRPRLLALLALLEAGCGWSRSRIFLFGYAQGGTAAIDLLGHACGPLGGDCCRRPPSRS